MRKPAAIVITVPEPCGESWAAMTPNAAGRHCAACAKTVTDFTGWTDAAIAAFYARPENAGACGRFLASQLGRSLAVPHQPHSALYRWVMAAGIAAITLTLAGSASAQVGGGGKKADAGVVDTGRGIHHHPSVWEPDAKYLNERTRRTAEEIERMVQRNADSLKIAALNLDPLILGGGEYEKMPVRDKDSIRKAGEAQQPLIEPIGPSIGRGVITTEDVQKAIEAQKARAADTASKHPAIPPPAGTPLRNAEDVRPSTIGRVGKGDSENDSAIVFIIDGVLQPAPDADSTRYRISAAEIEVMAVRRGRFTIGLPAASWRNAPPGPAMPPPHTNGTYSGDAIDRMHLRSLDDLLK